MDSRGLVLIVDDNATNLKLARVTLEFAGFEVATAGDAAQARAAIRARPPRLILMDIQLPDIDGLTLTRELKANPATAGIRILALSAYAMKGDDAKARAAGCDGYITKPIDTRTLAVQVEAQLSAKRPYVLLVEDDPAFGKLLRIGLSAAGFEIDLAPGVEEARAALVSRRPDALIVDGRLRVPGDGAAFCREFKRSANPCPVIMLSGSGLDEGETQGPDLLLLKTPEVLGALPETLRGLIASRRGA